jgi:hypothetical protein
MLEPTVEYPGLATALGRATANFTFDSTPPRIMVAARALPSLASSVAVLLLRVSATVTLTGCRPPTRVETNLLKRRVAAWQS